MGEAPEVAGTTGAGDEEDTSSAAPVRRRRRQTPPAPVRSANDQRVITFMRNKNAELESKLKAAERELERLKSRPVLPFGPREEFLLGEIELISRQLQGWPSSALFRLFHSFNVLIAGFNADVNPDWKAEQLRVDERVEKEAAGDTPAARLFWSNKSKGSVLARMLDRTWRAALLLEGCRKTLWQINRVYFPHNEQPNGLAALLEKFREGGALKEVVYAQLVAGANAALAYVRMHRPHLPLCKVLDGLPGEDDYADTLGAARQMIQQVQSFSEHLVGPLDAPKGEPVE